MASAAPATATTTTTVRPSESAPITADAQAALDQYLDGLETESYTAAMEASTEGPRLLAFVRSILKASNEKAGASSSFAYTERDYRVDAVTSDRVTFVGRAVLRQTTTLDSGEKRTASVVIGDVGVRRRGESWLLTEMVWDGAPVQYSPSGDVQAVNDDVSLRLAGAVRFANATVVIVAITADKEVHLRFTKDRLAGSGFSNASKSGALVTAYGYFSYPRTDAAPTRWSADVTVDDDPARRVALTFA